MKNPIIIMRNICIFLAIVGACYLLYSSIGTEKPVPAENGNDQVLHFYTEYEGHVSAVDTNHVQILQPVRIRLKAKDPDEVEEASLGRWTIVGVKGDSLVGIWPYYTYGPFRRPSTSLQRTKGWSFGATRDTLYIEGQSYLVPRNLVSHCAAKSLGEELNDNRYIQYIITPHGRVVTGFDRHKAWSFWCLIVGIVFGLLFWGYKKFAPVGEDGCLKWLFGLGALCCIGKFLWEILM
jgi:hypothetical protein